MFTLGLQLFVSSTQGEGERAVRAERGPRDGSPLARGEISVRGGGQHGGGRAKALHRRGSEWKPKCVLLWRWQLALPDGGARPAASWGCRSHAEARGSGTGSRYPAARGVCECVKRRREGMQGRKMRLSRGVKNRRQPVIIYCLICFAGPN